MSRFAHGRTLTIAVLCWSACLLWLWPRAVLAGTLSQEVKGYDWTSLGYACALGALGGALALIVALATDSRVVTAVLKESLRNALVSPIAGAVVYVGQEAAISSHWLEGLSPIVRFLAIVGGGWAGIALLQWVRQLGGKLLELAADWIVAKATKAKEQG